MPQCLHIYHSSFNRLQWRIMISRILCMMHSMIGERALEALFTELAEPYLHSSDFSQQGRTSASDAANSLSLLISPGLPAVFAWWYGFDDCSFNVAS